VLAFPDGLAGVYQQRIRPWLARRFAPKPKAVPPAPTSTVALPGSSPPAAAQPRAMLPDGMSRQQP
jgi:urea transport system permease protein